MIPGEYLLRPMISWPMPGATMPSRSRQYRRSADPGRFALSFLRGQQGLRFDRARPSGCGSIFPRERRCASSPATTRRVTLVRLGGAGDRARPQRTYRRAATNEASKPSRDAARSQRGFTGSEAMTSANSPRAICRPLRPDHGRSHPAGRHRTADRDRARPDRRRATKPSSAAAKCCATAWANRLRIVGGRRARSGYHQRRDPRPLGNREGGYRHSRRDALLQSARRAIRTSWTA